MTDEGRHAALDQIIAATARALGCTVVTRDKMLLDYASEGRLHARPC